MSQNSFGDLKNLIAEKNKRDGEALRLFRPMKHQEPFFKTDCLKRIARGGNRCLGGEQEIWDPVAKVSRRVSEITEPFHVESIDPNTGKKVIAQAGVPFRKEFDALFRFRLSNGQDFVATMQHHVLTAGPDHWMPLSLCWPRPSSKTRCPLVSSSDTSLSAFPRDVQHWTETLRDSQSDCHPLRRSCGEQPHLAASIGQGASPSQVDAQGHTCLSGSGVQGSRPECSHPCSRADHLSILGALRHALGQFVASGSRAASQLYSQLSASLPACRRFAEESFSRLRTTVASALPASRFSLAGGHQFPAFAGDASRFQSNSQSSRRSAASTTSPQDTSSQRPAGQLQANEPSSVLHDKEVYITEAEYLRVDDVWDFEVESTSNYIIAGIVHHNSGKSSVCSIEFAHAATGLPLFDSTGTQIPDKYPRKNPLILWVIGYDLDHVARNIYRLLFQPGCFKLIKDLKTGQARAFCPWDPEDAKRAKDAYPAPPLIPERLVEEFAWENKAQRVFKACRLKNGNEIRAFSSQGKEPQGDQCDVIWIDEDVENPELIMESTMRLADRGGRMFWSAFPKAKNFALRRLSEEAADTDPNNPTCREFVFRMSDNPYLDQKTRDAILAGMTGDEQRARDFGEYLDDLVAVYPTFDIDIHCSPAKNPEDNDPIDKAIAENGGEIPDDWTRYLVLDPGHARPAVLMAAVPPPELEQPHTTEPTIVCYDEIAIPRIDASRLATEVLNKTKGQVFEAFIIDSHAGRQTAMGRGETNQDHYAAAFEGCNLRSRLTRSNFTPASDDVTAGIQMVRRRLALRKHGRPGLRIITEKCPNLCRQIEDYKKTVSARNIVDDKPAKFQIDDLADDLRYLVSFEPQYRKPEKFNEDLSPAYREWLRIQKKRDRERDGSIRLGVLGGA